MKRHAKPVSTSHEHRAQATYDSNETFFSHVVLAVAEPIRVRSKTSDVCQAESGAGRVPGRSRQDVLS